MRTFTSREVAEFTSVPSFEETVILRKDPSFPKITVITPSYNQAEFLERTILSVLNQNYPNLEYIIIDGGSTDGSVNIIKKYERYLDFWMSKRDKGQTDAINKGFRMAKGDIVAWQNSDDVYFKGAFQRVSSEYKRHQEYDVFFGNIALINSSDSLIQEMRFVPFSVNELIYYGWNLSSQAVFWKKSIFERAGYLDDSFQVLFDWDWFIRLGKSGFKFRFMRAFLGGYRIHEAAKFSTIPQSKRQGVRDNLLEKNNIVRPSVIELMLLKAIIFTRKLFYYLIQNDLGYLYTSAMRKITNKKIA